MLNRIPGSIEPEPYFVTWPSTLARRALHSTGTDYESCLSLESFSHLQELFYYVLFLTCAGMAYTIGSVCVIKESKSTPVFAILSVTIGGIYYIHAVYAVIRLL
ncbi:uncharacterized protein LOC135371060 isoform X2 [Ornithodoros turicata]|uniref:uncharacterized protein LOC135371060 isoform X2 n=1 Tax=Ornithodoros turicata TaxID=34597 RepID=UPI003138B96A